MANHYQLPDSTVNAVSIPTTGRYLAHNHLSPIERAFLAADLHRGTRQLVLPTLTQAARLARVNVTAAWWANQRLGERLAIAAGLVPLAPPHTAAPKTNGHALSIPFAPEVDDLVLANIARTVGPERMLAAAVAAEAVQ